MELFDEIIQNKQLEDTITERQALQARINIGTKFGQIPKYGVIN